MLPRPCSSRLRSGRRFQLRKRLPLGRCTERLRISHRRAPGHVYRVVSFALLPDSRRITSPVTSLEAAEEKKRAWILLSALHAAQIQSAGIINRRFSSHYSALFYVANGRCREMASPLVLTML